MTTELLDEGLWTLLGAVWDKRKARQAADEASDIYNYLRTHAPQSEYEKIRDKVDGMSAKLAKELGAKEQDGTYALTGALHTEEMGQKVGRVRAHAEEVLRVLRSEKKKWERKEEAVLTEAKYAAEVKREKKRLETAYRKEYDRMAEKERASKQKYTFGPGPSHRIRWDRDFAALARRYQKQWLAVLKKHDLPKSFLNRLKRFRDPVRDMMETVEAGAVRELCEALQLDEGLWKDLKDTTRALLEKGLRALRRWADSDNKENQRKARKKIEEWQKKETEYKKRMDAIRQKIKDVAERAGITLEQAREQSKSAIASVASWWERSVSAWGKALDSFIPTLSAAKGDGGEVKEIRYTGTGKVKVSESLDEGFLADVWDQIRRTFFDITSHVKNPWEIPNHYLERYDELRLWFDQSADRLPYGRKTAMRAGLMQGLRELEYPHPPSDSAYEDQMWALIRYLEGVKEQWEPVLAESNFRPRSRHSYFSDMLSQSAWVPLEEEPEVPTDLPPLREPVIEEGVVDWLKDARAWIARQAREIGEFVGQTVSGLLDALTGVTTEDLLQTVERRARGYRARVSESLNEEGMTTAAVREKMTASLLQKSKEELVRIGSEELEIPSILSRLSKEVLVRKIVSDMFAGVEAAAIRGTKAEPRIPPSLEREGAVVQHAVEVGMRDAAEELGRELADEAIKQTETGDVGSENEAQRIVTSLIMAARASEDQLDDFLRLVKLTVPRYNPATRRVKAAFLERIAERVRKLRVEEDAPVKSYITKTAERDVRKLIEAGLTVYADEGLTGQTEHQFSRVGINRQAVRLPNDPAVISLFKPMFRRGVTRSLAFFMNAKQVLEFVVEVPDKFAPVDAGKGQAHFHFHLQEVVLPHLDQRRARSFGYVIIGVPQVQEDVPLDVIDFEDTGEDAIALEYYYASNHLEQVQRAPKTHYKGLYVIADPGTVMVFHEGDPRPVQTVKGRK